MARAALGVAMNRVEKGVSVPGDVKPVKGDLLELRTRVGNNPYRLIYAREGKSGQILLALHAIHKKTNKLPKQTIQTAEDRLADWRSRRRVDG